MTMFFVAQEKIGTILGQQKEYTAAARRGIEFHAATGAWHYLFPADQIDPAIRAQHERGEDGAETPSHYIWSQRVGVGELIGDPVITPFLGSGPGESWEAIAEARLTAATAGH
jgi:hypothetical protein